MTIAKDIGLRLSPSAYISARDLCSAIFGVLFGRQSPVAKFSAIMVSDFPLSGDPDAPEVAHQLRVATPTELAYCHEAWRHAGLGPIEKTRRVEGKKYKDALQAFQKLSPKIESSTTFVIKYKTPAQTPEVAADFQDRTREVVGQMMASGEVELFDTRFRPVASYSESKLIGAKGAKAVLQRFGVTGLDRPTVHYDFSPRTPTEIHLSRDFLGTNEAVHRQYWRFDACLKAGLIMPDRAEGRLPDGIGKVGEALDPPIKHQSMALDLKNYIHYLITREAERIRLFRPGQGDSL